MKYRFEHVNITKDFAKSLMQKGWVFDWSIMPNTDLEVINLSVFAGSVLEGLAYYAQDRKELYNFLYLLEIAPHNRGEGRINSDVAGVILAYVARDSIEAGFDGFVVFEPISVLRELYASKYGAKPIGNNRMYFDTQGAESLVRKYLERSQA
ncbi:MAG: hypothetical protein LBG50_01630 [Clostridiales Family XIII bacterium]|jgi:hypothetical protein|nr:hypothetical protein [Clostridiales Family XIII bacterium]